MVKIKRLSALFPPLSFCSPDSRRRRRTPRGAPGWLHSTTYLDSFNSHHRRTMELVLQDGPASHQPHEVNYSPRFEKDD